MSRQNALRLIIALFVLLPFKLVARISLALAAFVFFWQPFELARLYALVAVSVVSLLARLHRWMEAQREGEEAQALAPALRQLTLLGRAYHTRFGFVADAAAQRTLAVRQRGPSVTRPPLSTLRPRPSPFDSCTLAPARLLQVPTAACSSEDATWCPTQPATLQPGAPCLQPCNPVHPACNPGAPRYLAQPGSRS